MTSVCILMCFFSVLGHLKLSPQLLQVCGLPAFMVILLVGDSREVDCNVWGSGKWTELAGINIGIHRYVS